LIFNLFVGADVRSMHTIDYHLALVGGNTDSCKSGSLFIPNSVRASADSILRQVGIKSPFVILHPGTARSEKMWDAENWSKVVDFIKSKLKREVLITGGSDEREREQIEQILRMFPAGCVFSIAGQTSLSQLGAIIEKSLLYVGVDTGASHMADALQVPSVVLFGGTNPFHWGPRSHNGRAVGVRGFSSYPHDFPKCRMREISAENMIGAIKSVLPLKVFTD
jgi:ADP-heptose:LPS heptosyltransferase